MQGFVGFPHILIRSLVLLRLKSLGEFLQPLPFGGRHVSLCISCVRVIHLRIVRSFLRGSDVMMLLYDAVDGGIASLTPATTADDTKD